MQSGTDRGFFVAPTADQLHTAEVRSLAIDSLNQYLTSCSLDQRVKLWDFNKKRLVKSVQFEQPIENLCYNQ